ncbi:atp-dependent clp protease atp-binding subunit clpa-like protein [Leptolyngbya sp. Heron Island J]|uniref:Clp protease N-terminal domain-containing protein n=1 Tax=Leptolyngbya sp. Heron Island J TaxID=1385935 RepID=UPI0003B96136|nr:Clp protease N-terminal domain-containing protein [Leptolyngbya sp. Heron Island J]ESA38355.1 atp-dependent clp protease atp-binding subunit clpa-like protein [Leptolyngbya sp. Heron Island J]
MFERFTEKSRAIIVQAQDEARRMGHNFVGTEQILLGMLADSENAAANVLSEQAITLEDARYEVEQIIGLGTGFTDTQIPFTPRAKRVLEIGFAEAKKLGDEHIEPNHILLGIILENEGVAAVVVKKLANSSDGLVESIYSQLSESD